MDDLELIFSMLGERVTTEISQKEDLDTFAKKESGAEGETCRLSCQGTDRKGAWQKCHFQPELPSCIGKGSPITLTI